MIISHRGNGNHNFKENSKEAIIFSLNDKNVDGIEIALVSDKEIINEQKANEILAKIKNEVEYI